MTDDQRPTDPAPPPRRRGGGFAALSPERRAEISRLGGRAAHAAGTAHKFTSEEGKAAGSIGGRTTRERRAEKRP